MDIKTLSINGNRVNIPFIVSISHTMLRAGNIDVCSNPEQPFKAGDLFQVDAPLQSVWEVKNVIEERPSRGVYTFLDYQPLWQRIEIQQK